MTTLQDPAVSSEPPRVPLWNNPAVRAWVYQAVVMGLVVLLAVYLVNNTLTNLSERSIRTGFGFLAREAGFRMGESIIPFEPSNSYGRALFAGFLNTLKVAIAGIVLCTVVGVVIGIARLSRNWLVQKLATVYVETMRNIPILLQLFFWYAIITGTFPNSQEAWNPLPGVFISKSGVLHAVPLADPSHVWIGLAFLAGLAATALYGRWVRRKQRETGRRPPLLAPALGLLIGLPLLVWLAFGAPLAWDVPVMGRFRFTGGQEVTPEFLALWIGLGLYTAAFVAEVVRGGILAVDWGQTEAAAALGLRRGLVLRLVVLPQALRVIIPPTTNQYLNLTKNSSLAVAVGYPELTSVTETSLNQTGQAVECIAIMMAVYLAISLAISAGMNFYNKLVQIPDKR
jgi:general L-amino acid transport system permease protein